MRHLAHSTIAQAIYADPQNCSFVRVVSELEVLLSRLQKSALQVRWDCEDVVVFDTGRTRIVLAWSEDMINGAPACLLVSVGPVPSAQDTVDDPAHDALCHRLVDRIQNCYAPDAVLWRHLPLPITADLVDVLTDALPSINDILPAKPKPAPAQLPELAAAVRMKVRFAPIQANDAPPLPRPAATELHRVRTALYPPAHACHSETVQMRLAAQAINATLIVVWMPLGVAAMTYSLMSGKDIGFSARMVAMTGALMAFSQSALGQKVVELAGA